MFSISRVAFAQRQIRDIKPRVEAAADRKQLERPLTSRLKWQLIKLIELRVLLLSVLHRFAF